MTKSQLVESVADQVDGIPMRDVEAVVETIFACMAGALAQGERIEIRGFGSFAVKTREARESRNPKTGEKVSVPRKTTPHFTPGKELKERVDRNRR